jgi:hypothetical protein
MSQPHSSAYSYVDALTWACDIASAVAHLHSLNPVVIHRDLKLENILLRKTPAQSPPGCRKLPTAKLTDFGLHVVSQLAVNWRSTVNNYSDNWRCCLARHGADSCPDSLGYVHPHTLRRAAGGADLCQHLHYSCAAHPAACAHKQQHHHTPPAPALNTRAQQPACVFCETAVCVCPSSPNTQMIDRPPAPFFITTGEDGMPLLILQQEDQQQQQQDGAQQQQKQLNTTLPPGNQQLTVDAGGAADGDQATRSSSNASTPDAYAIADAEARVTPAGTGVVCKAPNAVRVPVRAPLQGGGVLSDCL